MGFDLGIEGGTVVTPTGRERRNVYVREGSVAAVTSEREPASVVVDATGLLVLPGMVDTHVHLMDPAATHREDFPSGTAAAALAGVTTIVEHTHGGPVRTPQDLEDKRAYLHDRSHVDFGLAAHAWPDHIDQVLPLWRAGVTFLKVFTCTTHGVPGFDADHLARLFGEVASAGAVCLVHAEDETITGDAERALRAAGREDPGVLTEWRSRDAELTALAVVAGFSRSTGARVVAAHVSHADAVEVLERERSAGAPIRIETCPQYLTLLEGEVLEHGAFRKFTPPARARDAGELDQMWRALAAGRIDHVSTDHAPSTAEQKRAGSMWDAPFGLPGLDTTLPVLLDAASRDVLPYECVVGVYAEAPARAYGLFPRKGTLAIGSDADLALVDPGEAWTVRNEDVRSRAGWSPYAGRTFTGRTIHTFLRGRAIVRDGALVGVPGDGAFVPGPGSS
jgi:dihydroorotase